MTILIEVKFTCRNTPSNRHRQQNYYKQQCDRRPAGMPAQCTWCGPEQLPFSSDWDYICPDLKRFNTELTSALAGDPWLRSVNWQIQLCYLVEFMLRYVKKIFKYASFKESHRNAFPPRTHLMEERKMRRLPPRHKHKGRLGKKHFLNHYRVIFVSAWFRCFTNGFVQNI